MNVQVIASVNEARTDDLIHKTVIVIDVLRATSTMLTALANGCREIIPAGTVIQAKKLQDEGVLLGGERYCEKIPGFDLGNSPLDYKSYRVAGKSIVITTTNGTRAIQKAGKAAHILIGSMLNARACAQRAIDLNEEIVILCAGTKDVFSLEDGIRAGLIVHELMGGVQDTETVELNDFGLSMLYAYRSVQDRLSAALLSCANGIRLSTLGFKDDIFYCAQVNTLDFAPAVKDGKLESLPACY